MTDKKALVSGRLPNIELLRILTMIGVVILHINNPIMGNCLGYAQGSHLYPILLYIECSFTCAVDIFVCITGYFLSRKMSVQVKKPVLLIIQVIFFRLLSCVVDGIMTGAFSKKDMVAALLPKNYFVIIYCALYLLAPFINKMTESLSSRKLFQLSALLFVLFSVIPSLLNAVSEFTSINTSGLDPVGAYGNGFGYTIVQFVLMYILGSYLRKAEDIKIRTGVLILGNIIFTALICLWGSLGPDLSASSSLSHNNPLVVLSAVSWFTVFRRLRIKSDKASGIINGLAKGAFTVFLCHTIFFRFIPFEAIVTRCGIFFTVVIFIVAAGIYIGAFVLYVLYSQSVERIAKILIGRIRPLNDLVISSEN